MSDWSVSRGVRRLGRRLVLSLTVTALLILAPTALATFPGANGRIAYTLFSSGSGSPPAAIHTVSFKGAQDQTLTTGYEPAWSANGRRIAFVKAVRKGECGDKSGCQTDICTMRADGSDVRRLTKTIASESDPAYSPGGGRIVFTRKDGGRGKTIVSVRSADGSDPQVLAGENLFRSYPGSFDPEYAPDGRRIVYVAVEYGGSTPPPRPGIYTMRPDGSHKRLLVSVPLEFADRLSSPDYSPDGTHIIFQRYVKRWGITGTEVMRSDGSDRESLPCGEILGPVYSPNGGLLAFTRFNNIDTARSHPPHDPCDGSGATTYGEGYFAAEPSWQPLPGG